MSKLILLIKKLVEFVTSKMWKIRISKLDKGQGFLIKQLRVISLAVKGFNEDNCLVSATALTFYTLFSIVPILALVLPSRKASVTKRLFKNKSCKTTPNMVIFSIMLLFTLTPCFPQQKVELSRALVLFYYFGV